VRQRPLAKLPVVLRCAVTRNYLLHARARVARYGVADQFKRDSLSVREVVNAV